jgi:hypothetical protein
MQRHPPEERNPCLFRCVNLKKCGQTPSSAPICRTHLVYELSFLCQTRFGARVKEDKYNFVSSARIQLNCLFRKVTRDARVFPSWCPSRPSLSSQRWKGKLWRHFHLLKQLWPKFGLKRSQVRPVLIPIHVTFRSTRFKYGVYVAASS